MVGVDSASLELEKEVFFPKEQIVVSFRASSSYLDDAWGGLFPGRMGDDRAWGAGQRCQLYLPYRHSSSL
jgi:hypothetical protein